MSVKHMCDGCGTDITKRKSILVRVEVNDRSFNRYYYDPVSFDFCEDCSRDVMRTLEEKASA